MGKFSICLVKHNAKRTGAVRASSLVVDFPPPMSSSSVMAATRAFVKVILALAQLYGLVLGISRDSSLTEIKVAYRKLLLKTHPDKGGKKEDVQKLQAAKEAWDEAHSKRAQAGRPKTTAEEKAAVARRRKEYRVQANVVLLTYQGFTCLEQWHGFVAFVRKSLRKWGVSKWAATLEACETEGLHVHLSLLFKDTVDTSARAFAYEGLRPDVRKGDYLGEGVNKRRFELSVNRGFFYVFADKIGTQREADGKPCFEGNHVPVWVKAKKGQSRYAVLGKWCENLWKERKLTHEKYEEYLYLTRDGVLSRKRNLEAVRSWEEEREENKERLAATQRVKARLFHPFQEVPAAKAWLSMFKVELDRYPFLVVLARSRAGKTEWAKSLFERPLVLQVGDLEHFPDGMRNFSRKLHDGIVLDDLRDFSFCVRHQEKLQGKVDAQVEFASTPSGNYAYSKWLWKVPIVVTANYTTRNLDLLQENDFLGNSGNRVLVEHVAPQTW